MTRFRRKANHAHVYEIVRQDETHVTLRSRIENMLPRRTFEVDYEPVPGEVEKAPAPGLAREALEPPTAVVDRYATGMFDNRENMRLMPIEVFKQHLREFYTEALVQRTADKSGAKTLLRSREGGWILTEEVRLELQKVAEDWQDVSLEAVEAIALEVERRVLSCISTHTAAGADHECMPDPMGPERCVTCGKRFRPRGHTAAGAGPVGEAVAWRRDDLARALAALDGIRLLDIKASVGPEDDANNWRKYLGRADDLLASLSLSASDASSRGEDQGEPA